MTTPSAHSTKPSVLATTKVKMTELPLSCPTPATALWNSHPRVYLPIEASGEAVCPYCGAHYVLEQ